MAQYAADRSAIARPLRPVTSWDAAYLQQVSEQLPSFMRSDVADNTSKAYDSGVRRYMTFCQAAGLQSVPDPGHIQHFVAALVHANYKLSTIAVTMSGLRRWASDDWGMPAVFDDPAVQRALKVAKRLAVRDVRQKLPLSAADLVRVLRWLAQSDDAVYPNVRDAAMFVVGWAGMLRSSEIIVLVWKDVHLTRQGDLMLYLPKTKTDPGAGSWVLLAAAEGCHISPAGTMRALRLLSGGDGASGYVFRPFYLSDKGLAKTTVGCRLKKALVAAGIAGAALYAAHSLRRGGATHAARTGVPIRLIKLMGRWKSDAVREYLYASPESVLHSSRAMLGA